MSLQVNTIPQDLPPPETRKLIVESLQALRRATNAVFEKVEAQIGDERDQLQSLEARIEALEKKINQIPGSSKAITSLSLAQYPELARPAGPLLFPKMPSLDAGVRSIHTTHSQAAGSDEQLQIKGQDTKELYAFFQQLLVSDGAENYAQDGAALQHQPRYFTSLKSFGSNPAAGASLQSAPNDQGSHALSLTQVAPSQLPRNPHLAARSLVPFGSGNLLDLDLPTTASSGRRPDSLSPGPFTRALSSIQPDCHARGDMGAAVSLLGDASFHPPLEVAAVSEGHEGKAGGDSPGTLGPCKSGLDVLGSKHPDLQRSILHRQHSMSANSLGTT